MKPNRLWSFLKDPPIVFLVAIWVAAVLFVCGSIVLVVLNYRDWPSYIVYICAAALLVYTVYTLISSIPRVRKKLLEKAKRYALTNNLISSYGFRTVAFSVAALVMNVGFALFNGVQGIVSFSLWYGIIACYYIFLGALRGGILIGSYRAKKRFGGNAEVFAVYKRKLYRLCGIALFVLELALAAAVTLMILYERPTEYSEIMAITSAAYTFYKVIFAVVNVVKVRKLQDPMLQCFRNINLTDAAVSLLSLQVMLVAVFSDDRQQLLNTLNAITGFVVCALTIVIGIIMIVRGSAMLKGKGTEALHERTEE